MRSENLQIENLSRNKFSVFLLNIEQAEEGVYSRILS